MGDSSLKAEFRISVSDEVAVRASDTDPRAWLADMPVAEVLQEYGIAHTGMVDAVSPYLVRRRDVSGLFVMVCTAGEGRVLLEGRWKPMRPRSACIAPPHSFNAYRASPRQHWSIAWVKYQDRAISKSSISIGAPVLLPFDGVPLTAAVAGLFREASGAASAVSMQHWANLIQHYVDTLIEPWHSIDHRLTKVWQRVAEDLSADWPVQRLATLAGLGTRQFRRLCRSTLGRTPAEHLAALRFQHAAVLLSSTSEKVETVARAVGYHSLPSFSNAFKKFTGSRPSSYRRRRGIRID